MAYCNKCGAYIPDGLSACLACGYDESAQTKKNTGAAAKSTSDIVRERMEEQRRARQEENRRWAEQEESRRRQQEQSRQWAEKEQQRRQQQEQSRQWAEQEYARRQAERENAARNYTYRSTLNRANPGKTADSGKLFAALSYLSFLFVLPHIFCPQDEFAKFHAKQGLKLFIFTILADTLGALTGFGWILSLLRFYFIYKGMSNAFSGVEESLPYIGNIGN